MTTETPDAENTAPELPADVVRLGAKSFTLEMPKSYTTRHEIWTAFNGNSVERATAAALGVCVPGALRRAGLTAKYRGDVAEFGAAVLDALHEKDVPIGEVITAGTKAWSFIAESMPTADDIEEAAGN